MRPYCTRVAFVIFLFTFAHRATVGQCLTDFTKLTPERSTDYTAAFGASVAMHGNYLAVGVPGNDSLGHITGIVNIYEKVSAGWNKIATLAPSDPRDALQFGFKLKHLYYFF
jgi:hypothetical protein